MTKPILIYGANGFSGQRIAEVAARWKVQNVILGGRNGRELKTVAARFGYDFRTFGLDSPDEVRRGLRGVGVVLNAAGPFVRTADRLARSAIAVDSHYVDITGELDVYRRLDDLHRIAESRNVALVGGAGFTGAVSNMMIASYLKENGALDPGRIKSVRVAFSNLELFSRGSVATAVRSMREQVLVIRPASGDASSVGFVPQGALVRKFSFPSREKGSPEPGSTDCKIGRRHAATALGLVDTYAAYVLLKRDYQWSPGRIESYVQAGTYRQLLADAAALASPFMTLPGVRAARELLLPAVPDSPSERQLSRKRQAVLLEIEDDARRTVVRYVDSPNVYEATACCAMAVARYIQIKGRGGRGWQLPGPLLLGAYKESDGSKDLAFLEPRKGE